jgi:subtilisin family serine protease
LLALVLFAGAGPLAEERNQGASVPYLLLSRGETLPDGLEAAIRAAGGRLVRTIPEIGLAVAEGDASFAARAEAIVDVCPDVMMRRSNGGAVYAVGLQVDGETLAALDPPASGEDDTAFDFQWGADAIDLVQQRKRTGIRGSCVRVAVIDSGADMDHPDLEENINAALSESFVPGEGVDAEEPPGYPDGEGFFNHGSHVAGIIAAPDNGLGMIGVAPEAELVILKALSEQLSPEVGCGLSEWILDAIVYAGRIRADVVNMSLGGVYDLKNGTWEDMCTPEDTSDDVFLTPKDILKLQRAFQRAIDYAYCRGATILVAAGNDTTTPKEDRQMLHLPAECDHLVVVGATGPLGWGMDPDTNLDEPAFYSNYGRILDLVAPGGNIDFALLESGDLCEVAGFLAPCWVFDMVFSLGGNGSFGWASGTSMACPHAAGVAALIIDAHGCDIHPDHVAKILRETADDLGRRGKDSAFGHGRVNAHDAVRIALRHAKDGCKGDHDED